MAAFEYPTLDALWTQAKTIWSAERPDASVAPRSDVWLSTYITAKMWNRLHRTGERILDAIFPSTTYGVYLDYWLKMLGAPDGQGGYGRIIARGSDGGTLEIATTGAANITAGDQLTDPDGLLYQSDTTAAYGGAGTQSIDVSAVDTGSATNITTGTVLTFVSPPTNINPTGTLTADLAGGADEETDAAGRARLLELLRRGPSGSWSDWVQVIEGASPGALDAYVWPKRELQPNGWGRTDYCALQRSESGSDKHIALSSDLAAEIGTAVESAMPVLLMRNSRQLGLVNSSVQVEATITLSDTVSSDKECDWDAESVKATVSSSSNPQITASVNITGFTGGMADGDRVIIQGYELEVYDVGVGGNDKFKVTTWPWGAGSPSATADIMSGGGLIADVITGLETGYFDSLGPARGDYAAPISGWEDSVRVVGIQSNVIDTGNEDIVDVSVSNPAVTVTPIAGSGATTQRLIPGNITIWEDKP
jgi:hypothetical protein